MEPGIRKLLDARMPLELIRERQPARLDPLFDPIRSGAVAAHAGDATADLFEKLVVFMFGPGQIGGGLRACAIEDDMHFSARFDVLERAHQRVDHAPETPAAEPNADGSTTVYFSPSQPAGVKRGNWIQTMPSKGYFVCLRLYSPLEPFFTKEWRPSEIELVQ